MIGWRNERRAKQMNRGMDGERNKIRLMMKEMY